MNEKYVEALEQYDMEVRTVRKGRGSWICETDQGCRLLKEYRGTARRLEFEDEVLGRLDTRGSLRADRYLRNREGDLMTVTSDGTRYILKDWFLDRECNIKDGYEIRQALSRLAMLHSQLREIEFKEEWSMGSILSGPLEEELERHNREMQRARNYIRSKRKKSEFELCVIGSYKMFYDQALEAVQGIRELWPEPRRQPAAGNGMCGSGKCLKLGLYQDDQDALEAAEVQPQAKRTGSPCTCAMGIWTSTMCSWEAATQLSLSTTGCILEYRYRTCTVSCARSWKSTDGTWTWACPCWIHMKGCCPWSRRKGDACTTCSFILKNTGSS
mgnify:CR=1 FL=1